MAKRAKGWRDFNTDQKLEALRADVNTALDLTVELKRLVKQIDARLETLAREVLQMRRRMP